MTGKEKRTMLCPYCQYEHEDGLRFCPVTGRALRCFTCGGVLTQSNKFCTICGTPSPNIPLEPVEKFEELIELPEKNVESGVPLEQPQMAESKVESSNPPDVNSPEFPIPLEEPAMVQMLLDTQLEVEEQEGVEETKTLEPRFVSHDKVQAPDKSDEINNSVPPAQEPFPSISLAQKSCSKCGSFLTIGMRFCTNCGAPILNIPTESVEIIGFAQVVTQNNIDETSIPIKPPQELEMIEEKVELPEAVEPESILELATSETLTESSISADDSAPEQAVYLEETANEESLIGAPMDVEAPRLQGVIDDDATLESPGVSIDMGNPVSFTQDPLPSSPPPHDSCAKCGSILPPGMRFCTTCGTPLPTIPTEPVEKFEEQIESPEELSKPDSELGQSQGVEVLVGSLTTPDINSPEQAVYLEETANEESLIDTPMDVEESNLQEVIEEDATLESPGVSIDRGNPESCSQDPLPSSPPPQNSCAKCGSILPPGGRFCTACGTPLPTIPTEPVEKFEEQVKSPAEQVVSDSTMEQVQALEPIAESIITPDVYVPELAVPMEEPEIEVPLLDAPLDVEEPNLQEVIEEFETLESPLETRDEVEEPGVSIEKGTPVSLIKGSLPSHHLPQRYCTKCGSVFPRGASYCPSCGSYLLPAPRRNLKYLLFGAFGLILCMIGVLVLGCLGVIMFGIGKNPIPLPEIPIISNLAPLAQIFGEISATPPLTLLPTQAIPATIMKALPLTPTPVSINSPTATIIPTKVFTQTPKIPKFPSGTYTPGFTQASSQRMVAEAPCVSYYDEDKMSLKLACLIGKTWEIEVVDKNGDVGPYSSLAIDKNKNVHISYYDQTSGALKYAVKEGGTWKIETVDSGDVGQFSSLVLDDTDNPWISYYDRANGAVKLALWTGNDWNILKVDTMAPDGKRDSENYKTSLVMDPQGFPLIAYHHYGEDVLKLARWTGNKWDIQTIDPAQGSGEQCSLALDSKGNPGISYYDGREQNLKYAQLDGSTWKIQVADKAHEVGGFSSLTFDSKDNPHISYFDENQDNVKYTYWSGKSWIIQIVDSYRLVGFYTSLALDKNDRPYIAYYYFSGGDLRVTNWDGERWVIKNIDTIGKVGLYPSIRFIMVYP
jgi:rRNA maturation endonuclease Nob1